MKPRQIILTDAAVNDILEQAAWYYEKSGIKPARKWEHAVSSILLAYGNEPSCRRAMLL